MPPRYGGDADHRAFIRATRARHVDVVWTGQGKRVLARYQCYQQADGWHWRLLGANNRALAHSPEPLPAQAAAVAAAERIITQATDARIEIVVDGRAWRWVLLEGSTVLAVSTIGYARRPDCVRAVARFRGCAIAAAVVEEPLVTAQSSS